jgi:phosphoglycolate phosphatase-like HAD superfamily hydrolase
MAVWAFDVDGCIVDSLTGLLKGTATTEILERLRATGHTVVLWSAGGGDYARDRAEQHGVGHLVDATYGKQTRGADGRWSLTDFATMHRPSVLVDDRPEDAPHDLEVIAVSPYIAPDVHDRGMHRVLLSLPDPDITKEAS